MRLSEDLACQSKGLVGRTGRILTALVEDALRQVLAHNKQSGRSKTELPAFWGNGVQPGMGLDASARFPGLPWTDPRAG